MNKEVAVLHFVRSKDLVSWSVPYLLGIDFNFNPDFTLVKIGEFLTRNKTTVEVQDEEVYKRVTIKVRNNGVFLRDEVKGDKIGTKNQFRVKEGQFLISKIDARNGAFGVVPAIVDSAIITGNFWTFDIDYDLVNPYFLSLLTTTKKFIRFAEITSNGTTNRHYLQEPLFLNTPIPLPSIEQQNNIVAAYQAKINLANEQEAKAEELEKEIERYLLEALNIPKIEPRQIKLGLQFVDFKEVSRWGINYILSQYMYEALETSSYPLKEMGEIISYLQYGLSLKSTVEPIGYPFLRMNSLKNGELDLTKLKYVELNEKDLKAYTLDKNDLIFNRTNSKELVGKTAVFDLDETMVFASYLIRLKLNEEMVDVKYINYLFNSIILRFQIDINSRQVGGQANLNSDELKSFLFPCPPLQIQKNIVAHIDKIKTEIADLRASATSNRKKALKDFEKKIFID